jgi:hypothetical protein
MLSVTRCNDKECCCKCLSLKRLTEFNSTRLNVFCCVTFADCSDTVVFSQNPHGLCENFTIAKV